MVNPTRILGRGVTSPDLMSRLIRDRSGSPVSHVEYVLDQDWHDLIAESPMLPPGSSLHAYLTLPEGDYGTLGAHLVGGVQIRPTEYDTFSYRYPFYVDVTPEEKQAVMRAAIDSIGCKYCIETIFGDLIERNLGEPHEYDCSDFFNFTMGVAKFMQRTVNGQFRITPGEIIMSPLAIPL